MAEAVTKLPVKTEGQEPAPSAGEWRPLANLRREIDRLFDDFGWGISRRPVGRTLVRRRAVLARRAGLQQGSCRRHR
jgi:HSP20 family protein